MNDEDKAIMVFLKKAAGHYYKHLRKAGFHVEYEDLFGELGLAYSRALKAYREHGNSNIATLETYAARAFSNAIKDIKNNIIRSSRLYCRRQPEAGDDTVDPGAPQADEIIMADEMTKYLKNATVNGFNYEIFEDFVAPPAEVKSKMSRSKASVAQAVSEVHGCSVSHVYHQVKLAKKLLQCY